jgi:hypothetical protein
MSDDDSSRDLPPCPYLERPRRVTLRQLALVIDVERPVLVIQPLPTGWQLGWPRW